MTLAKHLNRLQILRTPEFPHSLRHICLIMLDEQLPLVEGIMESRPGAILDCIAVIDRKQIGGERCFTRNGQQSCVPLVGVEELIEMPHLEFVFCVHPNDPHNVMLTDISRILAPYGVQHFYMHLQGPLRPIGAYKYSPDFYIKNASLLERVYQMLEDKDSREAYAGRIKAILTGNPAYMPISSHPEYYHPLVKPEKGDFIIDGGVSDMVQTQENFAESVGEGGAVFGFEPMPGMCRSATRSLSKYKQYHVFCQGLGARKEKLHFTDQHDASKVSEPGKNTVECEIIDIDTFMREHKLNRLDCIKLDVEGSELAALHGAAKSIKKYRPKLIICIYHKLEDLTELPHYIKMLVPEYQLYVAHSSAHFVDTVLYAKIPD